VTEMAHAASEGHGEARNTRPATPGQSERQRRRQRRLRRHVLDRIIWTAAGTALGAGLVTIAVYIMIGDWI
jgi:hypothetical protein